MKNCTLSLTDDEELYGVIVGLFGVIVGLFGVIVGMPVHCAVCLYTVRYACTLCGMLVCLYTVPVHPYTARPALQHRYRTALHRRTKNGHWARGVFWVRVAVRESGDRESDVRENER